VVLAIAVIAIVLGFFAVDTLQTAPDTFIAIDVLGLLAMVLDAAFRRNEPRGRAPRPPEIQTTPSPTG
jgi:hypothetical protein